ncbi:hypothetical protein ACIBL8_47250 [Streptomyces sp. NPDC050523]|uniref:hypothetical protein n=1 Tax=Streptomyces sp. NPDC050523 TaxID=3365622 RepID=UPI0037BDD99F
MSVVAVAVVVVLYAGAGVLAITTGRAAPWQRGDILRPRVWGCGALLFGAGMALARYGGTVRDLTASTVVFACSVLTLICGWALQHVGRRAGRVGV